MTDNLSDALRPPFFCLLSTGKVRLIENRKWRGMPRTLLSEGPVFKQRGPLRASLPFSDRRLHEHFAALKTNEDIAAFAQKWGLLGGDLVTKMSLGLMRHIRAGTHNGKDIADPLLSILRGDSKQFPHPSLRTKKWAAQLLAEYACYPTPKPRQDMLYSASESLVRWRHEIIWMRNLRTLWQWTRLALRGTGDQARVARLNLAKHVKWNEAENYVGIADPERFYDPRAWWNAPSDDYIDPETGLVKASAKIGLVKVSAKDVTEWHFYEVKQQQFGKSFFWIPHLSNEDVALFNFHVEHGLTSRSTRLLTPFVWETSDLVRPVQYHIQKEINARLANPYSPTAVAPQIVSAGDRMELQIVVRSLLGALYASFALEVFGRIRTSAECARCGVPLLKRRDARFCGDRCRMAHKRANSKKEASQ